MLPCRAWVGGMVECGDVRVGVALAVAAGLWALGDRVPFSVRRPGAWAAAACLAAAFMNVTFYVAMGGAPPVIAPADAANDGVSIDVVPCR